MIAETNYLTIADSFARRHDIENGKFWRQAYGVLGGSLLEMLAAGKLLPEYFQKDFSAELHFKLSEQVANWINENLLDAPESASLRRVLEESPDHGRDHFRRLEKWYKAAQGKDKTLRSDTHYLYFSPSAFISEKIHDLVESYSGQKEKHDGAAALLTLGYVLQSQHLANDAVGAFSEGEFVEFPEVDWVKIAWGAAFICLHHSKPESMPSTEDLLAKQLDFATDQIGIINPMELIEAAEYMKEEANVKLRRNDEKEFESIEEFFPPYILILRTIDAIKKGELHAPQLDELEIEGLKRQTKLFAAADKLDSTYPADLSSVRTFQTRPQRPFYIRMEEGLTVEEELNSRIRLGAGHESPCDLDRLVFEMTRTKTFDGVSAVVQMWYARGLRIKGVFLRDSISQLLEDKADGFLSAYDSLEEQMARAILVKAGFNNEESDRIAMVRDKDIRRSIIESRLRERGYDPSIFEEVLYRIRSERENVHVIIDKKISMLRDLRLSPEERSRIRKMLILARIRQDAGFSWMPGPSLNEPLPYDGYILVTLRELN